MCHCNACPHLELANELEPVQDMAQHVCGPVQVAHLAGLHADGAVWLQHL